MLLKFFNDSVILTLLGAKVMVASAHVCDDDREKRALMAERHFHVAVTVLLVAQSICTAYQITIPFLKEE